MIFAGIRARTPHCQPHSLLLLLQLHHTIKTSLPRQSPTCTSTNPCSAQTAASAWKHPPRPSTSQCLMQAYMSTYSVQHGERGILSVAQQFDTTWNPAKVRPERHHGRRKSVLPHKNNPSLSGRRRIHHSAFASSWVLSLPNRIPFRPCH